MFYVGVGCVALVEYALYSTFVTYFEINLYKIVININTTILWENISTLDYFSNLNILSWFKMFLGFILMSILLGTYHSCIIFTCTIFFILLLLFYFYLHFRQYICFGRRQSKTHDY